MTRRLAHASALRNHARGFRASGKLPDGCEVPAFAGRPAPTETHFRPVETVGAGLPAKIARVPAMHKRKASRTTPGANIGSCKGLAAPVFSQGAITGGSNATANG